MIVADMIPLYRPIYHVCTVCTLTKQFALNMTEQTMEREKEVSSSDKKMPLNRTVLRQIPCAIPITHHPTWVSRRRKKKQKRASHQVRVNFENFPFH